MKIITQPSAPLFPIETCRQQCEVVAIDVDSDGIESHPDDALILGMLAGAVEHAERFTGLSIAQRTYELALDKFPTDIELPMPPIKEIVSIKYIDADLAEQTVSSNNYTMDDYQRPSWVIPATWFSWPATASVVNAVKIRFIAGFGEDSDSDELPKDIEHAVKLLLGHWYKHREDSTEKALVSIPNGFESLLRKHRILFGMA